MLLFNAVWELRVQLCRNLEKQPIEASTGRARHRTNPGAAHNCRFHNDRTENACRIRTAAYTLSGAVTLRYAC